MPTSFAVRIFDTVELVFVPNRPEHVCKVVSVPLQRTLAAIIGGGVAEGDLSFVISCCCIPE